MIPKIRIYCAGELVRETTGVMGETLLQCISAAGMFLDAQCGGKGKCGKCLVRISPNGEKIRACRTAVSEDTDIYLPDDLQMKITVLETATMNTVTVGTAVEESVKVERIIKETATTAESAKVESIIEETATTAESAKVESIIEGTAVEETATAAKIAADLADNGTIAKTTDAKTIPLHTRLGVAIDIGTTTVVAHLIDIITGARIATASGVNAQRIHGADVISRIQYCAENGHETMTKLIRDQIASLIRHTCTVSGERARDIGYISIAGNTIMEHLAAGYSPVSIGVAPYTPVSLFGGMIPAWEGLPASKSAEVYLTPAISSYVGGDVTAGMLAAGLNGIDSPAVYLDIGTNGEIVLKSGDTYYCCAAAAGPAFEGAEITMGMAAVHGAIDHVKWDDGLKISVIGDGEPRGICGSGLLDALAVLLDTGAVDETGRLLNTDEIEHSIATAVAKAAGNNLFLLTGNGTVKNRTCANSDRNRSDSRNGDISHDDEKKRDDVYITSKDIRKLQLAKAAIAAGIQTLLHHAGVKEDQVKAFVLAGGFGSFIDQFSAARIGMFPKSFLSVIQAVGNTAGEGAALTLRFESARAEVESIRKRCEYIELSTSAVFNEQFVEQMTFYTQ